jgi:hypothetical protein
MDLVVDQVFMWQTKWIWCPQQRPQQGELRSGTQPLSTLTNVGQSFRQGLQSQLQAADLYDMDERQTMERQ